jgi:6,7-dimethyl-8-ribityllumazine synthase
MSSKDQNLSDYSLAISNAGNLKIGIVVSDYNEEITHQLLDGCTKTLIREGVMQSNLRVIHVPGAFELPTGARMLDDKYSLDAVIALGCVIKGDTKHDEYINQAVATGLMQLSLLRSKPFIFGVLTPNTQVQALERAGGKLGNKGVEAAVTALKMASLKKELKSSTKQIGFS